MPSNAPENSVTSTTVKNPVSFTSASQQANQPADFVPIHLETRTPISTKVKCQHQKHQEENKLAAQYAANMKANRGLRKICASKAFVSASACLLFLVVAIGAQCAVKATTGVELLSNDVLIALTGLTAKALSAFLRVIHSLFPLGRSAGPQDENKKTIRQKK
jgi:hypothetical protein